MALPLPEALLNRVNKGLREECERVLGVVRRHQAVTRLERETMRAAESKVAHAKERLTNLTRLEAQVRAKLVAEDEQLSQVDIVTSKLAMDAAANRVASRDLLDRVDAINRRVDAARERLRLAEESSEGLEQQVLSWIEGNKVANSASGGAATIFEIQQKQVERLHREATQLAAQQRRMESECADEASVRDTILVELQRCRSDAAAERQEILRLQTEIATAALKNAEDEAEGRPDPREELEDCRKQYVVLRTLCDEARMELKLAEDTVATTQQKIYTGEAKRARTLLQLAEARHAADAAAHELRALEVQASIAMGGAAGTSRQLLALREELESESERLAKANARLLAAKETARAAAGETDAIAQVDAVHRQMIGAHEADVSALSSAQDFGVAKIQRAIVRHGEVCAEMGQLNDRVLALTQAVDKSRAEEDTVRQRLQALDEAIAAATNEAADVRLAITEEDAALREDDAEKRAALKARIEELKQQLAEEERRCLKSHRQVEFAQSELRQAAIVNDARHSAAEEIQGMMNELQLEITSLQTGSSKLAADRGEAASVVERLEFQLHALRRRVEAGEKDVATIQSERAEAEIEAARREASLVADIDAGRVELHSAEAERRQLSMRLTDARTRATLLKSRHDGMLRTLADRVNAEVADAVAAETRAQQAPAAKSQGPSPMEGALMVTAEDAGELSSEELQARCLLARATERESLLLKGNSLDDTIVQCEKDMRTISEAIRLLRARVEEPSAAAVATEDDEEAVTRFIEDVSTRFAQWESVDVAQELVFWSQEASVAAEKLREAREASAGAKAELAAAQDARTAALGQLRAAERHLQQLSTVATQERLRTERLRSVVRVTQQSVLSNPSAVARVAEMREKERVQSVEAQLWQLVQGAARTGRHPDLPRFYARLAAAFGIDIPTTPADVPTGSERHPMQPLMSTNATGHATAPSGTARSTAASGCAAGTSSATRIQPAPRLSATNALVAAMAERQRTAAPSSARAARSSSSSGLYHRDQPSASHSSIVGVPSLMVVGGNHRPSSRGQSASRPSTTTTTTMKR